jgi:hypothetical protein
LSSHIGNYFKKCGGEFEGMQFGAKVMRGIARVGEALAGLGTRITVLARSWEELADTWFSF